MTRIGLIGAGHFGVVHARALSRIPGVELAAVAAGDPQSAALFAAEHGGRVVADWRALLDDRTIEAVVIATPHALHTEIAVAALAAGKHVLLEKPMAATPQECRAIAAAAKSAPGLLMVGHVMHFFRPLLVARDIIAAGQLGSPVAGRSALMKLWMESNRRPWHLRPETGGGMLMTAGLHALDQLVWLMQGRVAGVSAFTGTFFHAQEADDTALLLLRFEDGRTGQVTSLGYRDGAVTNGVEIVCERGVVAVDLDRGVRVGQGAIWRDVPDAFEPNGMDEAVYREWQAFLAAIAAGGPSPVDAGYGGHIVDIIAAAQQASRERREVAVAVAVAASHAEPTESRHVVKFLRPDRCSDRIRGNWATLLLPISTDDSIDFGRLGDAIDTMIAAKVDGIYSNGTAGEFCNQTEAEFDAIQALLADRCGAAKMPFVIGACQPDPRLSLGRVRRAAALSPAAIQVILPDWWPVTPPEAIDFLGMAAEAAEPVPLILYHPPHVKRRFSPSELAAIIAPVPQVVGIKLGDGDAAWYAEARAALGEVALFVPGHHLATGVAEGVAVGAFSNVACLSPRGAQAWTDLMHTDLAAALEIETRIRGFMDDWIAPFGRDQGFSNAALDKLLAAIGGWAETGTRLRRPYRWIPEDVVPSLRAEALKAMPEIMLG